MSTQVQCAAPILGTILRVIKLNSCGVPVTGASSAQIVMDGFTQVQDAPQYDIGDRKITRLANGSLCHNYKLPDVFTNDTLTIDFCVWHPGLIVNTVGGRLLTATASPTGTGVAYGEGLTQAHWSLELWQGIDGAGSCDPVTGAARYFYHAWPHLTNAKRGQNTMGNDPTTFQLIADTMAASALWTAGNSWLGAGQVAALDHYLFNITTTAPPSSACIIADYP